MFKFSSKRLLGVMAATCASITNFPQKCKGFRLFVTNSNLISTQSLGTVLKSHLTGWNASNNVHTKHVGN